MVVDMVAKVEVVSGTTWEENSVDLGKLLVCHGPVICHDKRDNTGASGFEPLNVSLHDVGLFASESWVIDKVIREALADNADDRHGVRVSGHCWHLRERLCSTFDQVRKHLLQKSFFSY